MKIKLVNVLRLNRYTFPPYGLGILKTYLKKHNVNADIFDLDIVLKNLNSLKNRNYIDVDYVRDVLWGLPRYLKGEEDNYLDEQLEKIVSVLNISSNEVVCFHVPHKEIYFSLALASKIKKVKDCSIIFGSLEIKRKTIEHLNSLIHDFGINYVDHFVKGDPYAFFNKLIDGSVPAKTDSPYIHTQGPYDPEADWDVPEFNKEHLDMYRVRPDKIGYFFPEVNNEVKEKMAELKGVKKPLVMPYKFQFGCYNRCAYCGFGKGPQKLPVDNVLRDIEYLSKRYKTNNFYFLNTNIAIQRNYTDELLQRLQREQDIKWSDTANLNMVNPEVIRKFGKSGCIEIFMGFATASEKLHNYVGRGPKNNPVKHFSECFKATDENGIWLVTDLICGLPYERNKDIIATRDFLLKNKPYINGILTNQFVMMKESLFAQYPKRFGLKVYQRDYSVNNISNDEDITVSNFGSLNFEEIYGLNWEKKKRQMQNSSRFFKEFITQNFPKQFYSWYPIFLFYNNFDSKQNIKKFLDFNNSK